jgi:hypothetical protein
VWPAPLSSKEVVLVVVHSWTSKGPIAVFCIGPYHTFCFGVAFVLTLYEPQTREDGSAFPYMLEAALPINSILSKNVCPLAAFQVLDLCIHNIFPMSSGIVRVIGALSSETLLPVKRIARCGLGDVKGKTLTS